MLHIALFLGLGLSMLPTATTANVEKQGATVVEARSIANGVQQGATVVEEQEGADRKGKSWNPFWFQPQPQTCKGTSYGVTGVCSSQKECKDKKGTTEGTCAYYGQGFCCISKVESSAYPTVKTSIMNMERRSFPTSRTGKVGSFAYSGVKTVGLVAAASIAGWHLNKYKSSWYNDPCKCKSGGNGVCCSLNKCATMGSIPDGNCAIGWGICCKKCQNTNSTCEDGSGTCREECHNSEHVCGTCAGVDCKCCKPDKDGCTSLRPPGFWIPYHIECPNGTLNINITTRSKDICCQHHVTDGCTSLRPPGFWIPHYSQCPNGTLKINITGGSTDHCCQHHAIPTPTVPMPTVPPTPTPTEPMTTVPPTPTPTEPMPTVPPTVPPPIPQTYSNCKDCGNQNTGKRKKRSPRRSDSMEAPNPTKNVRRKKVKPSRTGALVTTRVVGGTAVSPIRRYPWLVVIINLTTRFPTCGGSIINNRWILTAAHCLATGIVVRVGDHHFSSPMDDDAVNTATYRVLRYIRHPRYTPTAATAGVDLGLLQVHKNIIFNTIIGPVCLPNDDLTNYKGQTAVVIGWGLTTGGAITYTPEELNTVIEDPATCTWLSFSNFELCTRRFRPAMMEGVCRGDSGGPLVVWVSGVGGVGGNWVQVGVVQRDAESCTMNPSRDKYIRVSKFLNWIQTTTVNGSCNN